MKLSNSTIINNPPYRWVVKNNIKEVIQTSLIGQENLLYEQATRQPLKDNNARTLFTMTLSDNRKVFVKRYKLNNLREVLKSFWFSSKAMREYQRADYLRSKEVLTVTPLAVLEKKERGITTGAFLLLENLDNCIDLKEMLSKSLESSMKKDILIALTNLIKQIQEIGFFHKDLHIGNVLVNTVPSSPVKLYLIDLHRGKIIRKLTRAKEDYNLAQMSYSLWGILPFTDVVRFLQVSRSDLNPPVFHSFLRRLFKIIEGLRHRHWRSRTKRCLKSSTGFSIYQDQTYRIFSKRGLVPEGLIELVRRHQEQVKHKQNLVKYSTYRAISRVNSPETNDVLVKEYRYSLNSRLANLFRMHRAQRSWLAANGFRVRGIPTPEALALIDARRSFLPDRGYLILREIKDAQPLDQYVQTAFSNNSTLKALLEYKREFIENLVRLIKAMYRRGIFSYDLKANNIMVQSNNGRWEFNILDLDRVTFTRRVSLARQMKNLAQLNAATPRIITRTDRMRFFNYYSVGEKDLPDRQKKQIVRKLMWLTIKRKDIWPTNSHRDTKTGTETEATKQTNSTEPI